jgi:hypothetical protein
VSDQKPPRKGAPNVEVIRRPAVVSPSAPSNPGPAPAPRPAPSAAVPSSSSGAPRPSVTPSGPRPPRPGGPSSGPRPGGPGGFSRGPRPGGPGGPPGGPGARRFPKRPPGPPPTPEQIDALAKKERVPARIAKGELEGKMKCRIWRKLHAEEAKRFDQVYTLLQTHAHLSLADGFGVVQSGLSVDAFLARKARTAKKAEVKEARTSVPTSTIDGLIQTLIEEKTELSVVLGERTLMDVMTAVAPVSFTLEKHGRLEKLQVVALSRKAQWEKLSPSLPRDGKLSQKPAPIVRQPDRRAVADPRPFLDVVGKSVEILLRNGIQLTAPLLAVGAFDVLLGESGQEIFVPLHAMQQWKVV